MAAYSDTWICCGGVPSVVMADCAEIEQEPQGDDKDFINAKAYMLETSTLTGISLYDHLARVLTKVLDERPKNVVDIIEDISLDQKRARFTSKVDTILDKMDKTTEVALAEIQQKLFAKPEGDEEEAEPEEGESVLPNILEICFYFEQAGVGLNRDEMVRIWLALKTLVDNYPLSKCRFWGKVFGTEQNYLIAEVEYREGEGEEEEEAEEPEEAAEEAEKENDEEEEEDDMPKPDYKPPPVVPKEPNRVGCNKKTYFVCNDPGKPWTKLPLVTPAQISTSKKIKKFFTGRLDAPIISYPPFPGNEASYLRAQISRISAGTHISPAGLYMFDEEEEAAEEEEGVLRDNFIENAEFEPIPVRELIDPTMANWVHHVAHILPQGRCTWWNPAQKNEDEEEDEEEEKEEPDEPEPEVGPPVLTPLSEDLPLGDLAPWTARLSSKLLPQFAVAVVSSNLWPGATTFGIGKKFENLYIGWGHKYSPQNFSPIPPPAVQEEYPSGPEISEIEDPSPEEEAALRAQQQENLEAEEELEEPADDEEEED